jgi:hypothetical protein
MTMTVSSQAWAQACETVTKAMADFTRPYITPISSPDKYVNSRGRHKGTGNYVNLFGKRLLITNDHVLEQDDDHGNAVMFYGNDHYFRPTKQYRGVTFPYDTAIGHIADSCWDNAVPSHQAKAVPESKISPNHMDKLEEIFFVQGFPGHFSISMPGQLITHPASFSTQQLHCSADEVSTDHHFAVNFDPQRHHGTVRDLENPHGMSGSLVWNTRFFEFQATDEEWSPEEAVVTGLVFSWDKNNRIFCIKIEHVREAVLQGIEALGLQ